MNWVIIGSGNGLSLVRRQAITRINVGFIGNWTPGNKFQWNLNRNPVIFIQENAFENVVCQIGDNLVQGGDELTRRPQHNETEPTQSLCRSWNLGFPDI